jgi:hemerythrin-like domain-containing protein
MPRDVAKGAFERLRHTHRRIEERLSELSAAVSHLDGGRAAEAREVCVEVMGFFERAVARHERDEEETLFPRLSSRPDLAAMTRELEVAHEAQRALAVALAAALEPPAPAARAVELAAALAAAYREHIAREEEGLFPSAEAALDAATQALMAQEMDERRGR